MRTVAVAEPIISKSKRKVGMDYVQLLEGMKAHPYTAMIAASVVQGRITALFVGAFLAQGGNVSPIFAYGIFCVMDVLGDILYYELGRMGRVGGMLLTRKSWREKLSQLNKGRLEQNFSYAIFISKVTMVGSKPVIVAMGVGKVPFLRFLKVATLCALVSLLMYMIVGYFLGQWIL
ncbi:MAG: hypothetical protein UV43_C0038G0009 [Parcubacteria group bacterium GW2011_GWF2_42_7]|nr:MAG: hypothetical protein UU01_C0022G0012 [Parcubacteria group bacterium GW2011_GWA2_40_37]KKS11119.1 MAG: hypothetical protein UU66_C0028G0003 [Parcubacteria group bacterium GW2011_GWB1_41_5]KKS71402.1 MAG: hypothetical protein UV43_C0038G0009 [Parcubacteria group bacterium GW2011_GWF2_42_7]OGI78624.1 MAG: hypothetical protein A3C65_02525 [Candidatus Nomurabacteria bacterium RIFCSPHIGHO2_02_FULL_41_150]OGI81681.1 MAG: hypothetical protein A3E03_04090 [Candidatus Nomurabacteria bacterium RIF